MPAWEFLIFGIFLGIFLLGFYLLVQYNKKTLKKTAAILAKKGLWQEQVSCRVALRRYFLGYFDFSTRSSLSEYWWAAVCIMIPAAIIMQVYEWAGLILWILLFLPSMALFARRFRDVGLHPAFAIMIYIARPIIEFIGKANFIGGWVLWFGLAGLICMAVSAWVVFRASDPFTNKYGKIPNVVTLKHKTNKNKLTLNRLLAGIYFNYIQKTGNIRLLLILGAICALISGLVLNANPPCSILNYLWILFWFYFPFLVVLPFKFVRDGYIQDKGVKK